MPKSENAAPCVKSSCNRPGLPVGVFLVTAAGPRYLTPCKIHIGTAVRVLLDAAKVQGALLTAEELASAPPEPIENKNEGETS